MNSRELVLPADYADWLANLKKRILGTRQRALLSVNGEHIRLYHEIGREILERQSRQGWGAKVIDRLSADLRSVFPEMKGFSATNLKYMRFFAQERPEMRIGQQFADQLPWFRIVTLITKLSDNALREWYASEALNQSWRKGWWACSSRQNQPNTIKNANMTILHVCFATQILHFAAQ